MRQDNVNFMAANFQMFGNASEFFLDRIKEVEADYKKKVSIGNWDPATLKVLLGTLELNIRLLKRMTGITYQTNLVGVI